MYTCLSSSYGSGCACRKIVRASGEAVVKIRGVDRAEDRGDDVKSLSVMAELRPSAIVTFNN